MSARPILPSRRHFLKASAALAGGLAWGTYVPAWGQAPGDARLPPRSIHPYPSRVDWGTGILPIREKAVLRVSGETDQATVAMMIDTWQRFTFGAVELAVATDPALRPGQFAVSGAPVPQREPDDVYALTVNGSGIAAHAADVAGMRYAWYTLLQLLDADDTDGGGLEFALPHVTMHDAPAVAFRGLHLCIFHETTPHSIEKAIRLAAFYKFTHVVLEFWGMLRLETQKELSWPEAWSKNDARQLVEIARSMGLEVVPMFNCWGHASACRIKHGRHVVLDQNPRLASLFEPDGWTWCLTNPRAQSLLRSVCDELIDFAGAGSLFHIGCDEAYSHATCDRCRLADPVQLFADHVNGLAEHLAQRGRRPILWGDPLLERGAWPAGFTANGTPELPTHKAIDLISRKILIADWHYDVTQGDVPTLAHFRKHGFDALACPWNSPANIRTLARGAAANGCGVLMTTWHHLAQSIPTLAWTAGATWSRGQAALGLPQADWSLMRAATASHLRKLVPAKGQFDCAGWNPFELPAETD